MAAVTVDKAGRIAVVTIDRPPVNAIDREIRAGLLDAFTTLDRDAEVDAIVLICAGSTYMAGADLNEFDTGVAPPAYHQVFDTIENCSKPVVTALHGTALGGGLEAALACHWRCAAPGARMGLPELSLGIIPGAGGTQRLPRLIGAKAALETIMGVAPVPAARALELGLIDRIVEGDLREGAVAWASELAAAGKGARKTSAMDVDTTGFDDEFLGQMRALAARRMRGQNAPELAIEAIRNAVSLPFAEGIAREKEIGDAALASEEAKALRHVFFAEREVARIPNLPKDVAKLTLARAGIVGAGTMGTGIAIALADAGFEVALLDVDRAAVDRGLGTIAKSYDAAVARGRITEADKAERLGRIEGVTDYAALADSDLVIEAAFENMELKREIFATLDRTVKSGAVLATNTSTLNIDRIAAETKRPEAVIGLHFFSPANIMRLLEIVRADKTSPEVLATCVDLARRIRKIGVVVGIGSNFGFVGNRMMIHGYMREADQMLLEGATPAQIDKAIYDFGFAMGPWVLNDMAGVDIMDKALASTGATGTYPEPFYNVTRALVARGRCGQKTGAGFYRYEKGDRTPHDDPEVDALIAAEATRLGIERRAITDGEIRERCVYGLINEGAKILEEGTAYRAGDIDVIWTSGYGFPRHLGGPMWYADTVGLAAVCDAVRRYHERYGASWTPAPLLERLAREKRRFNDK